jgi:hypothetical protein
MGMIARKAMDAGQASQHGPKYGHLRPFFRLAAFRLAGAG